MGRTTDLDNILKLSIDPDRFSINFTFEFIKLLTINNQGQKAFQIAYETLLNNYGIRDVHTEFVYFFISNEKKLKDILDAPEVVQIDSAVLLEDNLGKKTWYIIEEREDNDITHNIYSPNHYIAFNLLGKSRGEAITFSEKDTSIKSIKIIDIIHKYVYFVNNTVNNLNIWFPDLKEIKIVDIGTFNDISSGKSILYDMLRKSTKSISYIEQFYRENRLSIGAFSTLIKRDHIETWEILVSNPELGVRCCSNDYIEMRKAVTQLRFSQCLVIDIISLLTIHLLKAEDIISKGFKKLGIAQSTIDIIRNHLVQLKGMKSDGYIKAGVQKSKITGMKITPENIAEQVLFFEKILIWAMTNCKVLICKAALDINRHKRNEIQKMFGKSFIDTVLISSEPGRVLYSDDSILRTLAEKTYGIESIWSQAVFKACLNNKIIDQVSYNKISVELVRLNYLHTFIDVNMLMESVKQSKWGLTGIYIGLFDYLVKHTEMNTVSQIAAEFLLRVCERELQPDKLKTILSNLITALNKGKNSAAAIEQLKKNLVAQPTERYNKKLILFIANELIPFIDNV